MAGESVEFAESALVDLEDMRAWYAEQGMPEVGVRFLARTFAEFERLVEFPESGR